MIELNKIYNEDCLETLKKIEDNSIDLIITSPPYNKNYYHPSAETINSDKNKLKDRVIEEGKKIPIWTNKISYDEYDDCMNPEDYSKWQKEIISECLRVLKPSGSLFYNHKDIICDGKIVPPLFVYDFDIHQQIIWVKPSTPTINTTFFLPLTEYIYWFVKDKSLTFFKRERTSFKSCVWNFGFEKNPHPAPFPQKMIDEIIKCCTDENDIVYDPFMGSGTTGKSAKSLGRNYIGSEISKEYVKIAEERINETKLQVGLW